MVKEQEKLIKDIQKQAVVNENLAAELPKQPAECGQRTLIDVVPQESYAKLSSRLLVALKESNDVKVACYDFNEKVRTDRKKIHASRT